MIEPAGAAALTPFLWVRHRSYPVVLLVLQLSVTKSAVCTAPRQQRWLRRAQRERA